MKKVIKIIFIVLVCIIFFTIFSINESYATVEGLEQKNLKGIITGNVVVMGSSGSQEIGEIISGADDFISDGASNQPIKETDLQKLSGPLYTTLLIIGIVAAVIIGLVIGIKFMTGSVAEKAKVKETLIPYIAGCIVIFGAFAIWKLVVEILSIT